MASAALLAAGLTVGNLPTAQADDGFGVRLRGTFVATSNGEWAQTNDSYWDEQSVRSNWKIDTTCSSQLDCTGTITSDQGWTAAIYRKLDLWHVLRDIPGWAKCPDGTSALGFQHFYFWPAKPGDPTARQTINDFYLVGWDDTRSASGACGRNTVQTVRMPFKLIKIA